MTMEPVTLLPSLSGKVDCLLIDNFDSFTWNLYQQLCLLGATVTVIRNDAIQASAIPQLNINSLVISPGPGHPKFDSGISRDAISYFAGKVPILGVCMGLECVVDVYGGEIGYAGEIMHGKLSRIRHDGRGCFNGLPQGFKSTRYHSLSASLSTIPDELMVTSATEESGVIMGVRHRKFTVEAVQYHPESILSEAGNDLLRNFLSLRGGTWGLNPQSLILDGSLPSFPTEALTSELQSNGSTPSKMTSILEKICTQRLKDVQVLKSTAGTTPSELDAYLALHLAPPVTPLISRLKSTVPTLMAEIKRASPSKGPIALTANAPQLALTYALSGAAVISVLTEPTWFKGSLSDMRLVRQAIDTLQDRPAVLRKDFILEEYQIAEARLHGADTVLLIVAILPPARLRALYMYSLSLGMEPLVEVNNAREMDQALELGAKVIGVNNRNLHNFEVDLNTTSRLVDMVRGRDVVLCALSGIATRQDIQRYRAQGVDAFLIGEALMKAKDTPALIRDLFDYPEPTQAPLNPRPLVKICGIRTVQEAVSTAEAGADMLGLVFAPSSKRLVPLDDARQISSAVRSLRSQTTSPPFPHLDDCKSWFASHASRLLRTTLRPLLIGVFQTQPLETILDIVAEVQLDMVQLHGSEPLEWASRIPVPVIRAFHVNDHGGGLEGVTRPGYHQFILLDATRSNADLSGGAGKVFDWALARHVVMRGEFPSQPVSTLTSTSAAKGSDTRNDQVESKEYLPIFLAGGLNPNNVADAVAQVNPLVVDVSSGVEVDGGKDLAKIKEFIHAVRMNP